MNIEAQELKILALEEECKILAHDREKIRDRQLAKQKELSAAVETLNAMRKAANMSESEKAALAQIIQAEGVESGEDVGIPGA